MAAIEPIALEAPLGMVMDTPMSAVRTLVALLVRVRDVDGAEGWGEVWCNFPRFGMYHRARILREIIAPATIGKSFESPAAAWAHMTAISNILRLQSGESGPIAAVIAGIDIAIHDLVARKAGVALWRMLGGQSPRVAVYASLGRGSDAIADIVRARERGYRSFKLRSSGSIHDHIRVVRQARQAVGPDADLMLDLNSSWDLRDALATIDRLAEFRLAWLEEPIPVDATASAWATLAKAAPMLLAGGENMVTEAAFEAALADGALGVIQPDITKWGGFSGTLPLARRIHDAGRRFCPHMFSTAPGILASAHVLAASGLSDGTLECGVDPNPLRDALLQLRPSEGFIQLPEAPGLGLDIDPVVLEEYRIDA